jgi:ATP-dependent helicase/DNAse subunit B
MLLRTLLKNLASQGLLPIYAPIVEKSGFLATIAAFIAEAQHACVVPGTLKQAQITPYDAELDTIYTHYLATLDTYQVADGGKWLRLAYDALTANPSLLGSIDLVIVDGFDQFTPLQLALVSRLTHCANQTVMTLTGATPPHPAHRRFERTRQQLTGYLHLDPPVHVTTSTSYTPLPPETTPAPPLATVAAYLFDLDSPTPVDAAGAVCTIAAADREREVRAALRHARHLLNEDDTLSPHDIAIIYRAPGTYPPLLREVAAEYRLSLAMHDGIPLTEAPAIIATLMLLRLPLENYPRRSLVETWRSIADGRVALVSAPCNATFGDPKETQRAATLLDLIARRYGITGGMHQLQKGVKMIASAPIPADPMTPPPIPPESSAPLLDQLQAFDAWLTPPKMATIADYCAWVQARIAPTSASDKATAISNEWQKVLKTLADAADHLQEPPVPYTTFISEITAALANSSYGQSPPTPGALPVLPVHAARGQHYEHVIILGIAESEFPQAAPTPTIYSRRERALLAQRGIVLPPPDAADERTLFYEAITRARRSLTLARTYLDERGNPLPPSPYLASLLSLLQPESVNHIVASAGSTPTLEEAASDQEVLIALLTDGQAELQTGEQQGQQDQLPTLPNSWQHLTPLLRHTWRTRAVEYQRESLQGEHATYGPFEGIISPTNTDIIEYLNQRFNAAHLWSVTQINTYTDCPFRFVAAHILRLQSRMEPEEGLESAERGRIYHDILSLAGKQWIAQQLTLTSNNEQPIMAALGQAMDTILANAPTSYGFAPGPFWEWEQGDIRRRLTRAIRRSIQQQSAWSDYHPIAVEQPFGTSQSTSPLKLPTHAGDMLVIGRIDRIDQHPDGSLAVLDYKSSSSPRPLKETLKGIDVQLSVYLLAVETLLMQHQQVGRAAFFHLGGGKYSSPLTTDNRNEAIAALQQQAGVVLNKVRSGIFPPLPQDTCSSSCPYTTICRLSQAKPLP